MGNPLRFVLDQLITEGKECSLRFKNDASPGPVGPGKIEKVTLESSRPDPAGSNYPPIVTVADGVYQIMTPATIGQGPGARRTILPVMFSSEDVLWILPSQPAELAASIEGPAIAKARSGLHIPGGSERR